MDKSWWPTYFSKMEHWPQLPSWPSWKAQPHQGQRGCTPQTRRSLGHAAGALGGRAAAGPGPTLGASGAAGRHAPGPGAGILERPWEVGQKRARFFQGSVVLGGLSNKLGLNHQRNWELRSQNMPRKIIATPFDLTRMMVSRRKNPQMAPNLILRNGTLGYYLPYFTINNLSLLDWTIKQLGFKKPKSAIAQIWIWRGFSWEEMSTWKKWYLENPNCQWLYSYRIIKFIKSEQ